MKPIEITLTNFRSFRSETKLDFRDLNVFAVIGDTGAGKTSLLQAITYALFNRPTWDGRGTKELIADGASAMKVVLVFAVNGVTFTVVRNTRRVGTAQHKLFAEAINLDLSGENEVNAYIAQALGMDADTFLHTVLLPQGEHARLLTASGSKKNEILDSLYGLNVLKDIDGVAKGLRDQGTAFVEATIRQRERFAENPMEVVASAEAQLKAAEDALRVAEGVARRVGELNSEIALRERELSELRERQSLVERLSNAVLAISDLRARELPLLQNLNEARSARSAGNKIAAEAQAEMDAMRSAGQDFESLRFVVKSLDDLEREVSERAVDAASVQALATRISAVADDANGTTEELNQNEAEAATIALKLQTINQELKAARDRFELLVKAIESEAAAKQVEDLRDIDFAKAIEARQAIEIDLKTAQAEAATCEKGLHDARLTHEAAKKAEGAAQLAEHLHPGDDCPICLRRLPPNFVPPKSAGLSAARDAELSSTHAMAQASEKVQTLAERRRGALAAEGVAKEAKEAATAELAAAHARVRGYLESGESDAKQAIEKIGSSLEVLEVRRAEAEAAGVVIQERLKDLRQKSAAASALHTELHRQHDELVSKLEKRNQRCETLTRSIPAAFPVEASGGGISEARLALEKAITVAHGIQRRLEAATRSVAEAASQESACQERVTNEILLPRAAQVQELREVSTRLQLAPIPEKNEEHDAWIAHHVQPILDSISEDEKALEKAVADIEGTRLELATIVNDLGEEPDKALTSRSVSKAKAEANVIQAKADAQRAAELDGDIARVTPARQGLTDLCDILRGTQFKAYARTQRQKRLLSQASLILKSMTEDQFDFTEEFSIVDHWTNETRSTDSLSGGEQFLCALALSLAVVDIAASSGARIESLFLDEGFNALDSVSLDRAMTELRKRSRAPYNHMIGIISHVKEVTQYVNRTFRIEKTTDGSKVALIDGDIDEDAEVGRGLVSQLLA